ncbi:hypothetical protein BofuT4_P105520.1 [Botrytis cinerea T4]|uniref:Uncharacterized protein n=1 Tax=Botryotinia fuckeliana (strain T4) TaxID=999810 RepID=G2Y8I7_BOTF4|nr:hypothetical protein BofuT4_P105520.1 [Botrytis cinerea T4]
MRGIPSRLSKMDLKWMPNRHWVQMMIFQENVPCQIMRKHEKRSRRRRTCRL